MERKLKRYEVYLAEIDDNGLQHGEPVRFLCKAEDLVAAIRMAEGKHYNLEATTAYLLRR